jgi:hypothetical protein
MNLSNLKKVTIIADDALETYLIEEIIASGSKGYTVEEARGEGFHNLLKTEINGKSVRIDTIVSSIAAEKILEIINEKYLSRFNIVTYLTDVCVLGGEKYI